MYFSINRFAGDGTTTQWEFNFSGGYIDQSHVKVLVTDTLGNETVPAYTWVGPNTISIVPAVIAGYGLEVYRDTPKNLPLVDYTDGAIVSEKNLDTTAEQSVFVAAEVADRFSDIETLVLSATTTAVAAAESAEALATASELAATSAQVSASSAQASASSAQASLTSIEADLDALVGGDFSDFLRGANNLSDLGSAPIARSNLGLGNVDNTADINKPVSTAQGVAINAAVAGVTKVSLGLGNVDNTADMAKPVSTVQASAISAASNQVLSDLVAAGGSDLVGFQQTGAGAVVRTAQDKMREWVNVKDFGAVGDGIADDTAAIQAAIDHCALSGWPALQLAGVHKLSATLNIDRPVTTMTREFIITGGTLLVSSAITLFSSSLPYGGPAAPYTKTPQSEYIRFVQVAFESSNAALAAYVFSDKYLRITFDGCSFEKIKALKTAEYTQSIAFLNCRVILWQGAFFSSADPYQLVVTGNQFEAGASAFVLTGTTRGSAFTDNLHEGASGGFLDASGAGGVVVTGNYFEGNAAADVRFGTGLAGVYGVAISGNLHLMAPAQLAIPDFYPVVLGIADGVVVSSNFSNGNLCDNSSAVSLNVSIKNNKALGVEERINSSTATAIVATPGGGQAGAYLLGHPLNILSTVASGGDSVKLPNVASVSNSTTVKVLNIGVTGASVFPSSGQRVLGFVYDGDVTLAAGSTKTFAKYSDDTWVEI